MLFLNKSQLGGNIIMNNRWEEINEILLSIHDLELFLVESILTLGLFALFEDFLLRSRVLKLVAGDQRVKA